MTDEASIRTLTTFVRTQKVGRNKRSVSGLAEHSGNGLRPYPGLRLRKRQVFLLK